MKQRFEFEENKTFFGLDVYPPCVNREHYTGKIKPDMSKIGRVLAELKFG